jgi:hypothetical protein
MWWARRRVRRSEREMIEAVERIVRVEEEIAATRTGEKSSTSEARVGETSSAATSTASSVNRQARTTDGNGLLKYVMLYALTLPPAAIADGRADVSRPVGAVAGAVVAVLVVSAAAFTAGQVRYSVGRLVPRSRTSAMTRVRT